MGVCPSLSEGMPSGYAMVSQLCQQAKAEPQPVRWPSGEGHVRQRGGCGPQGQRCRGPPPASSASPASGFASILPSVLLMLRVEGGRTNTLSHKGLSLQAVSSEASSSTSCSGHSSVAWCTLLKRGQMWLL